MTQDMNHTYMKALRAVIVMTVTMLSGSNAMADGVVVKGNVYGGGNAADVQVNTTVNISAGRVEGNVYGGGNLGDVGRINRNLPDYNYKWTDATVDPQNPQENYTYNSTGVCNVNITGSTVLVGPVGENATADKDHGNVFGGGKGDDNSLFYCEKGMVYSTNVIISAGTVKGTVFGGGEVGRVENNTIVTIGEAGANTSTPVINGDVFGAGKGLKTHGYSALVRGNPVVTVQGKTLVGGSVYGGGEIASVGKHKVKTSNNPLTPDDAPEDLPVGMPYTLANTNLGKCTVTIKDNVTITNNVFGAGKGIDDYSYNDSFQRMGMSDWESFADAAAYHVFLQTLALATDTHVSIEGNANVNGSVFGGSESGFVQYDTNVMIKGGVIGTQGNNTTGDVYGGGRGLTNNIIAGRVNGNTNVNILGGTIRKDVYGGAALAKSNAKSTSSTSGGENPTTTVTYPTATVNLLGGIIGGDAYGGGLGNANTAADVGNTKVNLNGIDKSYYDASDATMKALFDPLIDKSSDLNGYPVIRTTETTVKGAIVNQVFGANNTNGTPLGGVTVHVFGTQNVDYANISAKVTCPVQGEEETAKVYLGRLLTAATKSTGESTTTWLTGTDETILNEANATYGNNSATSEDINTAITKVKTQLDNVYDVAAVYGGGNNANYTPDAQIAEASRTTNVIIEGCDFSSIKNVYGGGNAAAAPATDVLILGTKIIDNLFGGGNGELGPEYAAHVGYYRTGSGTTTDYTVGTGKTYVKLVAGNIHNVYGGSNSNGDIRGGANTIMPSKDDYTAYNCCDNLITQNVYGGGKNADMSSGTSVVLGCMPDDWIDEIYAGSQEANVEGDVSLTITSGKFERVFGGNKTSGMIKGSITVNIEETTSCGTPIVIGELYGGGNQADYSIYGYDGDQPRKKADYDTWFATLSAEEKAKPENQPYNNPKLNVRAFTSIGAIYGGGYSAEMVADPTVNINVVKGSRADDATLHTGTDDTYPAVSSPTTIPTTPILGLPYPVHKKDEIGIIGNVFGGGNLATVYGSTTVNIGTESTLDFITEPSYLGTKGTGEETLETTGVAYIVNANGTFKTKVEGVNITENVYGGGNQANVTGNTQVNICEKEVTVGENLVWQSVTPGTAGVTIGGNVFGAGKGVITDVTKALVVGNGIVKMGGGSVKKSVYGGGELSQVGGNTDITVSGGTIGTSGEGGATYGNIYGGGFGTDTYGTGANDATIADYKLFGLIKGNTNITVSGGDILHNVYGGGAYGSVGEFTYDETTGMPTSRKDNTSGGIANVTITGGTIGTTGQENGMVFGSSRGNVAAPIDNVDPNDRLAWVYNANVVIGTSGVNTGPLIYGSLYGSGENGHTFNNTNVTLHSGTIGVTTASEATNITEGGKTYSGAEYPNRGNVYGGGCGTDTYSGTVTEVVEGNSVTKTVDMFNPLAGIVRGNATITITGGTVAHNVYGAGAMGSVGKFEKNATTKVITFTNGTGTTTIAISGGTIGVSGTVGDGNVFGAARGNAAVTDRDFALVYETDVTISGTTTTTQIKGNIYGGGEVGNVHTNTKVDIQGGAIARNVFGGGKGLKEFAEAGKVKGNTKVDISGGAVQGNVYGGGSLGDVGIIDKTDQTDYNYLWKKIDGTTANDTEINKKDELNTNTGICKVIISGGTIGLASLSSTDKPEEHGNVFGAGRGSAITWWCEKAIAYATRVTVTGGTVNGNVYGGGEVGRVEDDAKVIIGTENETGGSKPTITGSVFGAGAGLHTHGYSALVRGNTDVSVQGTALVGGSVYGGGETASVGKFRVDKGLPKEPLSGGYCTVTIQGEAKIGSSGTEHNVYGACKGVDPATISSSDRKSMQLVKYKPEGAQGTTWDDYEDADGNKDERFIWVYYTVDNYPTFLRTLALTSHPHVTIDEDAKVYGSVYGGGQRGITLGTVDVDITGGTVEQDVYGGGALADTNTGNWDESGYEVATVTADESVEGLYENSGTSENPKYTLTEDETASEGKTYYRQTPTWTDATKKSGLYTTSVDLTGGLIKGDAYGGGLGQKTGFNNASSNIEAVVWGDIDVNLGSNASGSSATAFYLSNYSGAHEDVVKNGRVFGCNNLNGSPKGDVTVTVWKTVQGNVGRTTDSDHDGKPDKSTAENPVTPTYELAAVYGGGNLADYNTTGKKAHVNIMTCEVSIQDVYGGGNAAKVPGTVVRVYGAYEIQEVFGGGNGKDPYTTDDGTNWVDNPGADIDGSANTLLTGGYIHEAYGGSNKKGTITGNVQIDIGTEGSVCDLDVEKMVGAGKDADVNGDLIMVLGCKPNTTIPVLYAGADNANVNGDVELTITSGKYGKVFGGNNAGGIIMGHIVLNIEETGECGTPIEIDELYLGGNEAMYSQYGYYKDGTTYKARTAAMAAITNPTAEGYVQPVTAEQYGGITIRRTAPYDPPVLNVVSCTRIGKVFGGGLGVGAILYGDPTVNINMIPGNNTNGVATIMTEKGFDKSKENLDRLGVIGDVYGGGYEADIEGNTTVNIGTASTVQLHLEYENGSYSMSGSQTVKGAYIVGNVYGGGKGKAELTVKEGNHGEAFLCAKAMVNGNTGTHVNIGNGMVRGNVYGGGEVGRVENNTVVTIGLAEEDVPQGETSSPVINGNVFGAGKGVDTHGYSALVRGTSTVTVQADAKVRGNVYGGGEIASVGKYKLDDNGLPQVLDDSQNSYSGYCYVTIKGNAEIGRDDMLMYNTTTGKPDDYGHVFGAGKGVLPYEFYTSSGAVPLHMDGIRQNDGSWKDYYRSYSAYNPDAELDPDYAKFIKSLALATQTVVTIEGNPFIKGSVYGGSENGFVQQDTHVTISGGQIGNGYVQMDDNGKYLTSLETPVTPIAVNRPYSEAEWEAGHLIAVNTDSEALRTLAATYYKSSLPECASWPYGQAANEADRYAPYDKFANKSGDLGKYDNGKSTEGGRFAGDDGHTFFGNVFGGGSGYYPYKPGRWFKDAGAVYGDTYLTIKGGHILTSVYGGNEMTDVGKYADDDRLNLLSGGNCYVTMIGGTLGVPRTLGQIDKHPVTCYLFGAGKGDQRVFFNKSTNVGNVFVHISDDARIYGSIFGGGEDGHVMKNVTMNIGGNTLPAVYSSSSTDEVLKALNLTAQGTKPVETSEGTITHPYIGTWGTSYVDGNVFGAGRGFGGDAYTAGNVAGTVTMNIYGGTMLGSVYGGGRLGSVGYGLFDAKTSTGGDMPGYGEMRPDNTTESQTGVSSETSNFPRGYVYMTIGKDDGTGPIIGNNLEYIIPSASSGPMSTGDNPAPTLPTDIKDWSDENWTAWKKHNNIPKTEFDTTTGHLTHTKGGNVFAGGMGRLHQLDGTSYISAVDWWKLGCVKSTTLTIKGGTIRSNVYGGGELGQVVGHHATTNAVGESINASSEIIIQGSSTQIGTEVKETVTIPASGDTPASTSEVTKYTFGSVFGGGYGSLIEKKINGFEPKLIAGLVKEDTKIDMQGGAVKASIYGGGEMASVGEIANSTAVGSTYVSVRGGTVGIEPITLSDNSKRYFGGAKMGNVYGGGSGHGNTVRSGKIFNSTNVTISDGIIYHNVYGGGAYGTVGDFAYSEQNETVTENGEQITVNKVSGISGLATEGTGVATVTITGGTIGYDGKENGMVFGSSRGDINQPGARDDYTAWVYDTHVTIGTSGSQTGPQINGTVYGSGENGHVFNDTEVNVRSGTIGIADNSNPGYTVTSNGKSYSGAEYPYRGNVYGGGCGTDKYYEDHALETHDGNGQLFNSLAGIVYGTTTVNITGGTVVRNVYGAGAMGSVGKTTTTEGVTTITGGTTTINVSGGTIGVSGMVGDGNVFGAARGDVDAISNESALVRKETNVSVTGGTVKGNVYGGGELGCVGTFTVSDDMRTFTWQDTAGDDNNDNTAANSDNKNTGICNVTVNGSSAVINGHVYGAGKGKEDTFWCEKGIAYSTNVNVKNGTVNRNVYGGGEVGRVETDTQVKIGNGTGTAGGTSAPTITGSVFGGGAGVETHGYSALVRGNTEVTVEGNADVRKSVYGGGEIASVGRYALDGNKMPSILQGGGYCYVNVQGYATIGDDVFGAGKGVTPHFDNTSAVLSERSRRMTLKSDWTTRVGADRFDWDYLTSESDYLTYLETLALATHPEVTIDGNATVSGSVFGGGELGLTKGSVIVNIHGGTIAEDVYGGGSLANTNTTNSVDTDGDGVTDTTVDPTTTVNLKSGTINRNVYGGGLGQLAKNAENGINYTAEEAAAYNTAHNLKEGDEGYKTTSDWRVEPVEATTAVEAKVYGEVLVKLNEPTTTTTGEGESSTTTTTYGDCVVKGTIFGCNNLNGSPQKDVTVHVYKTMPRDDTNKKSVNKDNTTYDLAAVYGGGNLASFCPDNVTSRGTAKANVIIDGCDLTSIETVYGGGNAAPAPATHVEVNSCYEIGTVFGGGNGKDALADGTENPGADVGYIINSEGTGKESYGTGVALAELRGGTIHKAFGGSNTKGNVRTSATVDLNEPDPNDCPLRIEEVYGAGNEADQDGTSNINLGCISYLSEIYGGAKNADVNSNVELTIQSGHFDRVFGGNNLGGCIRGSITVNIEETGCHPIVIGQLFGGGNKAGYSVRGYKQVTENGESVWKPREVNDELELGMTTAYDDPQVNVKSFTSIGEIYGGGYGESAVIVGNTNVNVNVAVGENANMEMKQETTTDPDSGESTTTTTDVSEHTGEWIHFGVDPDDPTKTTTVWQPEHKRGEIGTIGNVFGGGNEAPVHGSTNIIIGNQETVTYVSMTEEVDETDEQGNPVYESDGITPKKKTVNVVKHVVGANITGNVYGGGNAADVTGDTNVIIGKEKPTP